MIYIHVFNLFALYMWLLVVRTDVR